MQIKSCQCLISWFFFFKSSYRGYVWKLYRQFLVSTFSMTNLDTLVQILAHNSYNKYGFQTIDQVQNYLLTLLRVVSTTIKLPFSLTFPPVNAKKEAR